MKTTPRLALACLLCAGSLAAATDNPAPQLKFTWVDPADPSVTDVRRLGEQMIQQVAGGMINEVQQLLATKGPEAAIDLVHLQNLKLPAGAPGKPHILAVKRTSLRVRRPANVPDSADLAALLSIQTELMDGNSPPKLLVQHVEATGSAPAEWRVYRPIGVGAQCLACHGPAASLAEGVQAKLAKLYPEDKAVDYAASDWRGVIRVSILTPADAPPLKTKLP
jgi:hypothetical protein